MEDVRPLMQTQAFHTHSRGRNQWVSLFLHLLPDPPVPGVTPAHTVVYAAGEGPWAEGIRTSVWDNKHGCVLCGPAAHTLSCPPRLSSVQTSMERQSAPLFIKHAETWASHGELSPRTGFFIIPLLIAIQLIDLRWATCCIIHVSPRSPGSNWD